VQHLQPGEPGSHDDHVILPTAVRLHVHTPARLTIGLGYLYIMPWPRILGKEP
jgi:hypothetical protein